MATQARAAAADGDWRIAACWLAAIGWVGLNAVAAAMPSAGEGGLLPGLQMLLVLLLVGLHGTLSYGWRGVAVYFVIAVGVAFALEASSIATGFPFGFFVHHMPGPKPLGVPIPVALGYAWLGWFAWSIARLIVRAHPAEARGLDRFTTPLIASFILAGFDFSYDAIGSTVQGLWDYRHPSGYFGVPLSNFLGWLFTGWLFFQLFALVEGRFQPDGPAVSRTSYWLIPCFVWAGSTLQYPLSFARATMDPVETGGRSFLIADIHESAVVASLLTMVFAALAGAANAINLTRNTHRRG